MASLGEELLISADSHVIEDPHFWESRLPASFKDRAPVFPERQVGGAFQAHPGGWDPRERVSPTRWLVRGRCETYFRLRRLVRSTLRDRRGRDS